MILESDRISIIEYKTGDEKSEYRHQLRVYEKGLKKIYKSCIIEPYLIYLEKERGKKIIRI